MDKRTILAVVLSLAVLLIYQLFFIKPPAQKQQATTAQESKQISKDISVKAPVTTAMATMSRPAVQPAIVKKESFT